MPTGLSVSVPCALHPVPRGSHETPLLPESAAALAAAPTLSPSLNSAAAQRRCPSSPPRPTASPNDFIWGTATAAYQVEGAVHEDGRGPSIWDTFSHTPGKTFQNQTADVADDFYHRYPQDIELMQRLGTQRLPLLHRVAAHFPAGHRHAQPQRHRLLQAPRRRPARRQHRALLHPLSLGSPPGSRGQRRLDRVAPPPRPSRTTSTTPSASSPTASATG